MTGKSSALILRQMHPIMITQADKYDLFVDFPSWFSSLSIDKNSISYASQKSIESEILIEKEKKIKNKKEYSNSNLNLNVNGNGNGSEKISDGYWEENKGLFLSLNGDINKDILNGIIDTTDDILDTLDNLISEKFTKPKRRKKKNISNGNSK